MAQTIQEADLRREDAESLLIIEQARYNRLRQMEAELDALRADENAALAEIPDFDNVQSVVRTLNAALAGAESYNLVFSPVTYSGHIVSRTIDMNFTCWGYDMAKGIVRQLYDAPYRCQITAFTFLSTGDSTDITAGDLSVKLTITFFEYTPQVSEPAGG